jgi:peptide/nickel transport system permease protein
MRQVPAISLERRQGGAEEPEKTVFRSSSPLSLGVTLLQRAWRAVTLNRKVMIGSGIIGFFILVAIFGQFLVRQSGLNYTLNLNAPPSAAHWLGTNQGGQDVFTQLVLGTRATLAWAFLTGLAVVGISVIVGLTSGYFGGIIDDVLSVITNVFLVIPSHQLAVGGKGAAGADSIHAQPGVHHRGGCQWRAGLASHLLRDTSQ